MILSTVSNILNSQKKKQFCIKQKCSFLLVADRLNDSDWMHSIKGIWHKEEKENYSKAVVSQLFWNVGSLKFLPGNENECNTQAQAHAHTKFLLFIHYEKEKSSKRDRWMDV